MPVREIGRHHNRRCTLRGGYGGAGRACLGFFPPLGRGRGRGLPAVAFGGPAMPSFEPGVLSSRFSELRRGESQANAATAVSAPPTEPFAVHPGVLRAVPERPEQEDAAAQERALSMSVDLVRALGPRCCSFTADADFAADPAGVMVD